MGGFFKPNQYVKKTWDRSDYRPKRMQASASQVIGEINTTCNNLRILIDEINNVASSANSEAFSSYARMTNSKLGTTSANLSKVGIKTTEDLVRICSILAQNNKGLAESVKVIGNQMLNDVSSIEKFYNDGGEF